MGSGVLMSIAAILDVDGTLVDTNYHHALAWYRAFRKLDITLPLWRIHRHIGIGSDRIVASLTNDSIEKSHGDEIRSTQGDLYMDMIDEVRPLEGAHDLLVDLHRNGHPIVLASSGKDEEIDHYLELLDARDLVADRATSAEVDSSKPEPDVVESALAKAGCEAGVMIGDSTWDARAAGRAGVECLAVLTGGFSEEELRDAGAAEVFESISALRESLPGSALG